MALQISILFLDRQVAVVNKAAGILSQKDQTGDPDVPQLLAAHLRDEQLASTGRAGNPFVAPVHRLDRPASGILILARSSKSAARLSRQFALGQVHKSYLAVVAGQPDFTSKDITLWLRKESRTNTVAVSPVPEDGFQEAPTRIQVLANHSTEALLALFPATGRPHQLRATLAYLGLPIAGDLRYGSRTPLGPMVSLHAATARFQHPTLNRSLQVAAPLPDAWLSHWPWLKEALDAVPFLLPPFDP